MDATAAFARLPQNAGLATVSVFHRSPILIDINSYAYGVEEADDFGSEVPSEQLMLTRQLLQGLATLQFDNFIRFLLADVTVEIANHTQFGTTGWIVGPQPPH